MAEKNLKPLTDLNEVDDALRAVAKATRKRDAIKALAEKQIDKIRAQMAADVEPYESEIAVLEAEIEKFIIANKVDFIKPRSKKLTSGTIGLKDEGPKFTWPKDELLLCSMLKKLRYHDAVHTVEEPDKNYIKAHANELPLKTLGIAMNDGKDKPYYKLNKEVVNEAGDESGEAA